MVDSGNAGVPSGGKARRKQFKVTRSQISDFSAMTEYITCNPKELSDIQNVGNDADMGVMGLGRRNRYHHVCRHCHRAFSSGRALGGHIRIHGASFSGIPKENGDSSNSSSSDLLFKALSNDDDDEEEEEQQEEEEFSNWVSRKMISLYVLRSNPKRSSILMDPQFNLEVLGAKRSCTESGYGSLQKFEPGSEHRATGQVPSWPVTRNRSNRSLRGDSPNAQTPMEEEAADERDTANLLVMLSGNGYAPPAEEERLERELTEESVCDSKARRALNLEAQGSMEEGSDSAEDSAWKGGKAKDKHKKKKKKKKRKAKSEQNVIGDGVAGSFSELGVGKYVYRCNACKKVFNSHHALGGHRASHRNVKGCRAAEEELNLMGECDQAVNVNVMDVSPPSEGGAALSQLTQERSPQQEIFVKGVLKSHECLICHRVFASGQALGGHKRCHWVANKVSETTTVSVISTEQHLQLSGVPMGNFGEELLDLNEPLQVGEEELEVSTGVVDVVPVPNERQTEFENAGSCDP